MSAKEDSGVDQLAMRVRLRCPDLGASLRFYTDVVGMRVAMIMPADDPREAVLEAAGLSLMLVQSEDPPGEDPLQLLIVAAPRSAAFPARLQAPEGTLITVLDQSAMPLPPAQPALLVTLAGESVQWVQGRAGMRYRDLIPGRWGGRYIASHIRIAEAGPVPDYAHYHQIRLQLIYCRRGWARVVYEDQGPAFVLSEGDCVLQPPLIRHQVLESSAGLEVIEFGSPAVHATFGDGSMTLPTAQCRSDRDFGGQRFVRHQAASAPWVADLADWSSRDTGIAGASDGLADARVLRAGEATINIAHNGDIRLMYLLSGSGQLMTEGEQIADLRADDAICVPPGQAFELRADAGSQWLQISVAAD